MLGVEAQHAGRRVERQLDLAVDHDRSVRAAPATWCPGRDEDGSPTGYFDVARDLELSRQKRTGADQELEPSGLHARLAEITDLAA